MYGIHLLKNLEKITIQVARIKKDYKKINKNLKVYDYIGREIRL